MKKQKNIKLRMARAEDFESISALLQEVNLMTDGVKENLANFLVFKRKQQLLAVAGFEIYGNNALLRSVAVKKNVQRKGIATRLVKEIISILKNKDLSQVYLLTETAPGFFQSFGFKEVSREEADSGIKSSPEFQSLCPATAICMKMKINNEKNLFEYYLDSVKESFNFSSVSIK